MSEVKQSPFNRYDLLKYILFVFLLILLTFVVFAIAVAISYFSYIPRYVNESTLPVDVLWRVDLEGVVTQPPLLTENQAFIATHGIFYALDIHTGEIQWRRPLRSHFAGVPMVAARDMVIVGQEDGIVEAMDIETGKFRWRTRMKFSDGHSSPRSMIVKDDFVVVAGRPTLVVALSLDDGAQQWYVPSFKMNGREADVKLHNGKIYVADLEKLFLIDPETGKIIDIIELDLDLMQWEEEYLFDEYSVYRGKTFNFMFDLDAPCEMNLPYTFADETLYTSCGGVYAFSLRTGRMKWHYSFDTHAIGPYTFEGFASPPLALYEYDLYALFDNGEIHAISIADGTKQGVLATNKPMRGSVSGALLTSQGISTNGEVMVATFNDLMVLGLGKK